MMQAVQELYRPFSPWQKHPDVCQKHFRWPDLLFRLRPFFIKEDFLLCSDWVSGEMEVIRQRSFGATGFSENYFVALLESTNAQSLLGLVNESPAFGIDLYKAIDYYLPEQTRYLELVPNDVIFQLMIAPSFIRNAQATALMLPFCLEYLSNFREINKLIWLIDKQNGVYKKLATDAGFLPGVAFEKQRETYSIQFPVAK